MPVPMRGRVLSMSLRALPLAFAGLCVVLGLIGVFVPGVPSTEFILLAAWVAARSSPRFSAWLESHRLFGPMLRNWRQGRRLSRRAKWGATATMTVSAVILFVVTSRPWMAAVVTTVMAIVLIWLWRRPEPPAN